MIQRFITLPGLALTFLHLFCFEVKDAAGLGIIDQKHSTSETISVLDVLEQRFPYRARRSSPSKILEQISSAETLGIMRPHARKLSFAPELEDGNQVENLWNQKTSGIVPSKDQEKISYDHHMNPAERKTEDWGFMAQMNRNENVSVIPTRSESRESLNLTLEEESFPSSVTTQNSMTQTQTPPKLVFEKNSTNVEISTEGAKNTSRMSLLSPSSRLQLIRPTPSPTATSQTQIVPNNETSSLLEKNDEEFISNANITTQLKGPTGESLHLNETTETMQSLGSMSPDHSSFVEMNHTHNKLSLSSLQTLFQNEDLEDLDGLFSFFFDDTKTQRPEVLLSSILPSRNETTTLWPPQFKDIPETRPKSSFMATLASTGILFISVLMLVAFVSQVFFSPSMMRTMTPTTSRPELFLPSNFSPTLNAMARGEFKHPRVQFKQPPQFMVGKQGMRRRLVAREDKIIPSELFFHPILPLRILQLGKK